MSVRRAWLRRIVLCVAGAALVGAGSVAPASGSTVTAVRPGAAPAVLRAPSAVAAAFVVVGDCPFSYRYGASTLPTYAGVTIAGGVSGLAAGATYSIYVQRTPDLIDRSAHWVANVVADGTGRVDVTLDIRGAIDSGDPDVHGDGAPYGVFVSSTPGKEGDAYLPTPTIPGQVARYGGRIRVSAVCNPWTAPGGTSFHRGTTNNMQVLFSRGDHYSLFLLPTGITAPGARAGDLVLVSASLRAGGRPHVLWKVSKPDASRLVMQSDGNLVLYSSTNKPLWQSRTSGHPGARLVLQADGNLVVYSPANRPLWQSRTYKH